VLEAVLFDWGDTLMRWPSTTSSSRRGTARASSRSAATRCRRRDGREPDFEAFAQLDVLNVVDRLLGGG
jgi:hypothetical protein